MGDDTFHHMKQFHYISFCIVCSRILQMDTMMFEIM